MQSTETILPCHKKVKFRTKADADAHINRIKSISNRQVIPSRSYACSWCGTWHLTSKPSHADELEKLHKKIEEISKQLIEQKSVNNKLKSQNKKEEMIDKRIINLQKKLNERDKDITRLRADNRKLIEKMQVLRNKYENNG